MNQNEPLNPSVDNANESNHLPVGAVMAERYEIENVLGVGGFSIVYKAYDKKLQTHVAIKELYPPSLVFRNFGENCVTVIGDKKDYEYLLDRFVLEARTLAKYSSDSNIVNIYDCVLENNTAYIIMEYLEGQNLQDYILSRPEGKLKPEEAIPIISGVLDGLERIHKKGIVHRDIKPKNIILTNDGKVKIIDFGAARFYVNEKEVVNHFTKIFTPGYAPPEQYQQDKKQGAYTDVYAAAATFYFMLTGVVPEISVDRKLSDSLRPLSEAVPGIPAHVDKAVRRAMALNADLRLQSASEFKRALIGKKKLRTAQDEKKARIRRRVWLAVATVVLFAAGVAGFIIFQTSSGKSIMDDIHEDDTLELWLPVSESDARQSMQKERVQNAVLDYTTYVEAESGHKIEVHVTFLPESGYPDAISKAYKSGQMPDIYDSSSVTLQDSKLLDCTDLIRNLTQEDYALYDCYQNGQIPKTAFALGFDCYVLYINDKLRDELEAGESDSFDDLSSIRYDETGVYGICCRENTFGLNPNGNVYVGTQAAGLFRSGKALAYIGKVSESVWIEESLPGFWLVRPLPGQDNIPILPRTWSVYRHSDNRTAAASVLLFYFAGDGKQDELYLRNRDILPANRKILSEYAKFHKSFSFITDNSRPFAIA